MFLLCLAVALSLRLNVGATASHPEVEGFAASLPSNLRELVFDVSCSEVTIRDALTILREAPWCVKDRA